MERASELSAAPRLLGVLAALALLALLAGCGVDAPPVPPGQENPRDIRSIGEVNPSAYF